MALTLCCAVAFADGPVAGLTEKEAAAQQTGEPNVTGLKVLAVGVFSSTVERREHSASVADGIRDVAKGFKLLKRGTVVEAVLGTGIGLSYRLTGAPKGAKVVVDLMVRHPQMVNPDTQLPMTLSTAQFERTINAVEHSVWSFDTPGSLVPGEYVVEIMYRDRLLVRQVFQVKVKK